MIALFLGTIISCKQAYSIIQKIQANYLLSDEAKADLIETLRETIPTCPITIKPNGK